MLINYRISCRLPQTPRTPSTGMAHYFDDVFTRNFGQKVKPREHMRRSSTARSMGARSDFTATDGGDYEDHDEPRSIGGSVGTENAERAEERRTADAHLSNYVSEQLARVRSHQSADYASGDEFEAQLDGQ